MIMKTKSDITIAPAKKYAPPKYPAMAEAKSEPGLLKKLPSQWEQNVRVATAVTMLGAMALTGCGIEKINSGKIVPATEIIAETGQLAEIGRAHV
jgi:hypothetical protein